MDELSTKLELLAALRKKAELQQYEKEYYKCKFFTPYDYQKKFFAAGKSFRQRFLCAGNRCGKTYGMAHEVMYHATGKYPDWWEGHRFEKAPLMWCVGITGDSTRKVLQKELFGTESIKFDVEIGKGSIPRDDIVFDNLERDGNIVKVAKIKWYNSEGEQDGFSTIEFRSTQQGEHTLMGATVDLIWLDEEDPHRSMEIYAQCLVRTATTKGLIILTATPENGKTKLVDMFDRNEKGRLYMQQAGITDVTHLSEDDVEEILSGTPRNQWGMRLHGDIMLGEGMVYDCKESLDTLLVESFPIPAHWNRVCGIDIGVTHYTAAVWTALDPETDTIYVYDSYRHKGETPAYHTPMIKGRGDWIPCVLPHDADNTERGSGQSVAQYYRNAGLNAYIDTFHNPFDLTGGSRNNFVNVGVTDILERMNSGRFKIVDSPNNKILLNEIKNYQYKDGKIRKVDDDLVDAMRYSAMSVKFRGKSYYDYERESYEWSSYSSEDYSDY